MSETLAALLHEVRYGPLVGGVMHGENVDCDCNEEAEFLAARGVRVEAATPTPPEINARTFHDAWVARGMLCSGTHAIGEGLCQNVTAVLAAITRAES